MPDPRKQPDPQPTPGPDRQVDDNIDDLGRDVTDGEVDEKRHPQSDKDRDETPRR